MLSVGIWDILRMDMVHYLLSILYKSFSDVRLLQTFVLCIIPQQDEEWGEEERPMQMQEGEEEHRKKI